MIKKCFFVFYIPPKLIPFSIGLVQCAFVYSLSLLFLLDLAVPSRDLGTAASWAPSHIGHRLTKNNNLEEEIMFNFEKGINIPEFPFHFGNHCQTRSSKDE